MKIKRIVLGGFTLIETIVAIVIFTLAMGAVSGFILMGYRTQTYTWQQSIAIDEARKGIETMVREIREAREGQDGSFPIEKAGDKEFIFYSDINNDGKTERVRYFLGATNSGNQIQECQTSVKGGTCSVSFSNFLKGTLKSAQVKVSVDGDFGQTREYAEIFADGIKIGEICKSGCSDCPRAWQGTATFDVTSQASDNSITFLAKATSFVDPLCPHSMKARFEFSFTEDLAGLAHEFRKGVIKPTGDPPKYLTENEVITTLTSYVRNAPPIFEYYDQNGNKIEPLPARLKDTKVMKVYLVVNIDPNRPPQDFELESFVQLRNLKTE
jgi:prepilin-type N-terminal cleavage/methylation domain-containing protein